MMQNSSDKAAAIFSRVSKRGHVEAEVFFSSVNFQKVNIRKENVIESKTAINEGYGIRIIENGKVGFSYSTDLSPDAIDDTISKAESIIKYMDADSDNFLPDFTENKFKDALNCFDKNITALSLADKIKFAGQIEQEAYRADKSITNTEEVGIMTGVSENVLVSTKIPIQASAATYIGGWAEMIAQDKDIKEAGSYMQTASSLAQFNPVTIGQTAAERASVLLNAGPLPTQKIDLVLDPSVAVQFLGVMCAMFDAEQIYKGKSLLQGKLGKLISSPLLNIVDDGLLSGGLASAYYDDEGVPTQKTTIIKDGILNSYLYDSKNARRQNVASTGNSFRSSYKAGPSISPSNIYINPGQSSTGEFTSNLPKALYIFEVMGLHMVNQISGEFSLGAQGILIENGKKTTPIKGVMIAGNLLDFLKQVSFIGDDLTFFSSGGYVGSPTLVVNDIMVGS